jgi:hypothetical protein
MTDLPSLRAIVDRIKAASRVNDDGELTKESVAELEAMEIALPEKVEAYHIVYVELTTEACADKELSAYYEKRSRAPKASAERLKERLKSEIERLGKSSVKGTTCKATIELSPERVVIKDGAAIPPEYLLRPEPQPDKKRIAQTLKCGIALPFAKLVQSTHLRFR